MSWSRPWAGRRLAVSILFALAMLIASSAALADAPRRVGVVIALTVNATEERAIELSGALGDAIARELAVQVIAGMDADAALPSAGVTDGCIADKACVRDLGERLEVDEILAIVVVEVGERTQIEPTWIEVSTGRTVSRAAMAFEKGEDLSELFRRRAPSLLPHADRRPEPDRADAGDDAADEADLDLLESGGPSADAGGGRRMGPGVWTATGVGAVALAGGVGVGLATRSLYRTCDGGDCEARDGTRIKRRALAADALFATAAVSGGVAALLYWRSDASPERDVHVGAGPGGLGLSVRGQF